MHAEGELCREDAVMAEIGGCPIRENSRRGLAVAVHVARGDERREMLRGRAQADTKVVEEQDEVQVVPDPLGEESDGREPGAAIAGQTVCEAITAAPLARHGRRGRRPDP